MNAIVIDDDEVSGNLIAQYIDKTGIVSMSGHFMDPVRALSFLTSTKVDIVFLDIEMPGMSGMELLKALSRPTPEIILVTSHKEFASEAFEHKVVDYLVKPFSYPRFFKAVAAAKDIIERRKENVVEDDIVFVKKDNQMIRIRKSEILWVKALGDYAELFTAKDKFILHCTLSTVEDKLPSKNFIRVHRSYIVRIEIIEKVEDNTIYAMNQTIPIGKSYREEVFRRLPTF